MTNLLAGWDAEAAPALPELCAALQRFPGQAARAIAAVVAVCAPADRARAVTSLPTVAAEQGDLAAAKALYHLDGEIAPCCTASNSSSGVAPASSGRPPG
ncbi:hypothetical protein [Streptomyces sp. SAI-129]|uniref:hypothetical protein n=1 Tax=Streptomyces sp. SAI-129 TaxID=3377727 RepID=UPI003C7C17D5